MSGDEPEWRRCLIERVHQRDSRESEPFKALITLNNRLLDNVALLKAENLKLSVENQQIRTAAISTGGGGGKDSNAAQLAIYEKKLLAQQEELTELHKRRGENSQMIVDLNLKVEKLTKTLSEKEQIVGEQKSANAALKAEVQMLTSSLEELKKLNITLLDEHKALQLEFSVLEEKLRATKDENISLLDRLMRHKMKDADKLNEENETFLRKRTDKVKSEIEDAVREAAQYQRELPLYDEAEDPLAYAGLRNGANFVDCGRECGGDDDGGGGGNMHGPRPSLASRGGSYLTGPNPNQIYMKFDAHDNESHAVRWSPVERVVATGGGDRKVKLWDVGKGSTEPRAVLGGSNAGINSVDFDSTGSYILGTSNDRGARVWTVADHRLRHTLTGHGEKVMAAKYFLEPVKVVTGSHDRTLKIWDLRSIACIETKFAGSCCNDLVTTDSLGSMIISGHYDKKIRFWDIRTEKLADDVLMAAKITSLDMSKDSNYLICSVRDDTIKLLDLRKNQVITSFSHENFKLSCDWARASFNMNGTKIACGSADGSIYIWNISGRLETTLKGHTSAVNAVSWSPHSNALASVCKGKRCIIYSDS